MDETIPGKVPGEGTSEQTTVMPCKIQSFSSNAIYAERRLFHFSFFFSPSSFSLEFHLQAAKNFHDFFAGLISRSISISCLHIEVLCEENSPCKQNQAFHRWFSEWSSFLISSISSLIYFLSF